MSLDKQEPVVGKGELPLLALAQHSRFTFVNRVSQRLDRIEALSLVVMVLLVMVLGSVMGLQIFNRYVLQFALPWTQEVSLLCLIWMTFIGASVGVRHHAHFAVSLLQDVLPARWRRGLTVLVYLSMVVLTLVLLIYGVDFAEMGLSRLSSAMEIKMIWFYLAIPVSAFLMTAYLVERICIDGFPADPDEDERQ